MGKKGVLPEISDRSTSVKHLDKGVLVLGELADRLEDDIFACHDTNFAKLASTVVAMVWPSTTAAAVDGPLGLEGWRTPFHAERLRIATGP